MKTNNIQNPFLEESSFERTAKLRESIAAYIRRWPIFLISILFFLFVAWLYTRYLTPVYESNIKVLIKDSSKELGANMLLSNSGAQRAMFNSLNDEVEIIKSYQLVQKVINNLDLSNTYIKRGKVIDVEVYKNELPILLKNFTPDSLIHTTTMEIEYNLPKIKITSGEVTIDTELNQAFKINKQSFSFYNNPHNNHSTVGSFTVISAPSNSLTKSLKNGISIDSEYYSNVITISLDGANTNKTEAILAELVRVYNQDAKKDKSLEFEKTEEFIEERIAILNRELSGVEGEKETFQQSNDIANLPSEIVGSIERKDQLESQLLQLDTQLSLANTYKSYVNNQSLSEVLPSDISNSGGNTNSAVSTYNQLVMERNNLIANGATSNHPMVKNLETSISSAKQNILTNISKHQEVLRSTRRDLTSQLTSASGFKRQAPTFERIARDIDRQQQIKESLYLLLLEKREEAAISKAITEDKIKIINPPSSTGPVSPIKSRYYLGAFALGLLLPLAGIYIKELLKNKIETRDDLEELINGKPIVGEIPRINTKQDKYVAVRGDLSSLSEAFRIMRTNLEFVISKIQRDTSKAVVILVTSSIKGEGKTFISMNYAHTLGQLEGKKTIIIGSDIRNPQLHKFESLEKNILGLTDYLYHENDDVEQYIHTSKADNKIDILFSGRIPPNPTEMLMSLRFENLIKELQEKYDYIVIDSAPLVLVSDTYHISNLADVTLYVTRSEHTPKNVLRVPLEAEEKNRLNHLTFVLNDISTAHSGYAYGYKYNYGYGYGYGLKNRKRPFHERLLSSFGINLKK